MPRYQRRAGPVAKSGHPPTKILLGTGGNIEDLTQGLAAWRFDPRSETWNTTRVTIPSGRGPSIERVRASLAQGRGSALAVSGPRVGTVHLRGTAR